jgi:5,10-methylenetetrahydromethanopterin reductase
VGHLKFGLSLNVNESSREVVDKAAYAEELGFDEVWVADLPTQRYAFPLAAAIAYATSRIKVGIGLVSLLLHPAERVSHALSSLAEGLGERFALCFGAGDIERLRRVGVSPPRKLIPKLVLKEGRRLQALLAGAGLDLDLWLGAQGPRMLSLAPHFQAVLLNHPSPAMVRWALGYVGPVRRVGVYAPAYIFKERPTRALLLQLKVAAAVVGLGASGSVLRELGLEADTAALRRRLKEAGRLERIAGEIPDSLVEAFSIFREAGELRTYLEELEKLGVGLVVFGYPQQASPETIRSLAEALGLA